MTENIIKFGSTTFFSTLCLWVSMHITQVKGYFSQIIVIAAVSALIGFVPTIAGIVLSAIVMCILLCHWTDANLFPEAIFMVLISQGITISAVTSLLG